MNTNLNSETVWDALRAIPDPEFDINIVDLGLIYSVECTNGDIAVTMTLTTPTCPSGGWIYEGVKETLSRLPGVKHVNVAMVFDPAWTSEMLSESAQRQMGRRD